MNIKPDVVNFHFVDYCNYSCCYCFVKKDNRIASLSRCKIIVDNIAEYFSSIHVRGRINLVGGEVFMCTYLQQIIDYINARGIDVSIVTNGSFLTNDFVEKNNKKISSIGISVDSLNYDTNIKIGRCQKNKTISKIELIDLCNIIKKSGIKLKINHCISKFNCNEDISQFITDVQPDRFKIFQMSIVEGINERCKNMQVAREEFELCCEKYKSLHAVIEKEEEMKESYLMIDSIGDFYIDRSDAPLGNAVTESFTEMMKKAKLDDTSFKKRYIF